MPLRLTTSSLRLLCVWSVLIQITHTHITAHSLSCPNKPLSSSIICVSSLTCMTHYRENYNESLSFILFKQASFFCPLCLLCVSLTCMTHYSTPYVYIPLPCSNTPLFLFSVPIVCRLLQQLEILQHSVPLFVQVYIFLLCEHLHNCDKKQRKLSMKRLA